MCEHSPPPHVILARRCWSSAIARRLNLLEFEFSVVLSMLAFDYKIVFETEAAFQPFVPCSCLAQGFVHLFR